MNNDQRVFGAREPASAMETLGALPGAPLRDREGGPDAIVEGAGGDAVERALPKTSVLAERGVEHPTIGDLPRAVRAARGE